MQVRKDNNWKGVPEQNIGKKHLLYRVNYSIDTSKLVLILEIDLYKCYQPY